MMYVVLVLNLKVFQIRMLDFYCSVCFFSVCMILSYGTCNLQGPFGMVSFRWTVVFPWCCLFCYVVCCAPFVYIRAAVGVGYALRVSPAVTRFTVYRRPQVPALV